MPDRSKKCQVIQCPAFETVGALIELALKNHIFVKHQTARRG
jgi:hypothetical protein